MNLNKFDGGKIEKCDRDFKAELMLTAIEENSGHMIILATVDWGKFTCLQYNRAKPIHSRIELIEYNSYCQRKISKYFVSLNWKKKNLYTPKSFNIKFLVCFNFYLNVKISLFAYTTI